MEQTIVELSARGLALIPVIVALVALARIYINSYWAPLMSLGFGVVSAFLIGGVTFLDSTILGGVVVGLMASGLYSGASKMLSR